MILRYAKYLDLPFLQVIHITIVWIIKTPIDVFAWQPLRPLKTDPGQRMERSFLSFTGKQVETRSSSDGTRRGTWFSWASALLSIAISVILSQRARAPSRQRAEASWKRGCCLLYLPYPRDVCTGLPHRHTNPGCITDTWELASKRPWKPSPGELNYGLYLLLSIMALPSLWITHVS